MGASRVFVAGGGSGVLEFQTAQTLLFSLTLAESAVHPRLPHEDDEWFAIADDEAEKVNLVDLTGSAP